MNEHRYAAIHDFIRAIILGGFSFYVIHLIEIEKLQYYIAPKMMIYVKCAAVALFLLAVYSLREAMQNFWHKQAEESCQCGHELPRSRFGNMIFYGIFLFPLLLGFALPDKIMGSDVAALKGMNLTVTTTQNVGKNNDLVQQQDTLALTRPILEEKLEVDDGVAQESAEDPAEDPALDKLFPYDEYTKEHAALAKKLYTLDRITITEEGFLEIITAIDLYRDNFLGKDVEISGFIYREDEMTSNQFVVSRMAMTCCTADSVPYGFLSESSRAENYETDTWITLVGEIGLTTYNGNEIIRLNTRKVTMMEEPTDPYVYAYFGDFMQLVVE